MESKLFNAELSIMTSYTLTKSQSIRDIKPLLKTFRLSKNFRLRLCA